MSHRVAPKDEAGELEQLEKDSAEVKQKALKNATQPMPAAFKYKMTEPGKVLMRVQGTFWPLIVTRYEFYVYPLAHIALVVYASHLRSTEATGTSTEVLFGESRWEIPWAGLSITSPLMVFFLVFFLGQCYTRFNKFFNICVAIETGIHETAMMTLVHMTDPILRWDVVRYLTASAIIIYFRVTHLAEFKEAMVDVCEFERLITDEREFLGVDQAAWEKLMGWPRSVEDAKAYTAELHAQLGLSNQSPSRLAYTPPLLTKSEVEALRVYPGGMMSLVLQTWALQVGKETGEFKGPWMNALVGSVMKIRSAAYEVRSMLGMPVPMPYFHALNLLQNVNYAFYTVALLNMESNLTPLILFIIILITVGMREVAAALANPFGEDDVDFPVHKWISQLRGTALCVHPSNVPVTLPDTEPDAAYLASTSKRLSKKAI